MRIPCDLPQARQWASGKVGIKIWKLLTLKPALNPLDITDSSNQTSETTISYHLLCKFPWGTSRHSLLHFRLSENRIKKKKAKSEQKMHTSHAFIVVCWFGCWNWLIIEENKRCLLQNISNFHLLGKMFFSWWKQKGKNPSLITSIFQSPLSRSFWFSDLPEFTHWHNSYF